MVNLMIDSKTARTLLREQACGSPMLVKDMHLVSKYSFQTTSNALMITGAKLYRRVDNCTKNRVEYTVGGYSGDGYDVWRLFEDWMTSDQLEMKDQRWKDYILELNIKPTLSELLKERTARRFI